MVAVAVNCDVKPTEGADPLTATDVTVGAAGVEGVVGVVVEDLPPHAIATAAATTANPSDHRKEKAICPSD